MNPTDLADATARALNLLPSGDPANTDPRQRRDPRLAEEARLTQQTAADVWLAVSPLHVAPPDVLHAIMAEIDPPASISSDNGRPLLRWLAVSGWAAAVVLAGFLWQRPNVILSGVTESPKPGVSNPKPENSPSLPPTPVSPTRDTQRKTEILRLQTRLAEMKGASDSITPRVMCLTSPGAVRRSPEEIRRRVRTILTDALRSALEAESGAPSDPASLVIERGWLPGGLPVPSDGSAVRHRNFPEQSWQELGLLRSDAGEYYDASSKTLWTADPEEKGFIGRKITPDQDLTHFHADQEKDTSPRSQPRVLPEGFVIANPEKNNSEVVIDQVPPPAEGTSQFVVWTDTTGATQTAPVEDLTVTLPTAATWGDFQSMSVNSLSNGANLTGTVILTIPTSSDLTSFQLLERPLTPNGEPDKILIEGGP